MRKQICSLNILFRAFLNVITFQTAVASRLIYINRKMCKGDFLHLIWMFLISLLLSILVNPKDV